MNHEINISELVAKATKGLTDQEREALFEGLVEARELNQVVLNQMGDEMPNLGTILLTGLAQGLDDENNLRQLDQHRKIGDSGEWLKGQVVRSIGEMANIYVAKKLSPES